MIMKSTNDNLPTNRHSIKADVSGSISVTDWRTRKHIRTKSNFFGEPIIIKITDEKIIFTKPTLDFKGKTISPNCDESGWFYFRIDCEYLEPKKFDFDLEESDIDCRVVYYR
jgi:hypothetical protein